MLYIAPFAEAHLARFSFLVQHYWMTQRVFVGFYRTIIWVQLPAVYPGKMGSALPPPGAYLTINSLLVWSFLKVGRVYREI